MVTENQASAETFLTGQQRLAEPAAITPVVTTHISKIFLAGERVFKLKRAVRFAYVDFSTPELRLAACESELALNRRTAPSLYLAVRRITRAADGTIGFDGDGILIDAVVEMRRFDQTGLFDALALRNALTPRLIADLAHRIAVFHAAAAVSMTGGGAKAMQGVLAVNEQSLCATALVPSGIADDLSNRFRAALQRHRPLLDKRRDAGKVRRCHGDLILRNICLIKGVPVLFDCLEFNEDLATIDVLYDLAFLVMDLTHRDQADHANGLFNRYFDETNESDGLALMAFFMSVRAAVRAHVTAAQAQEMLGSDAGPVTREARAYFDLASLLLARPAPRLMAIGGYSGTGKSTIATALAPNLGVPAGARVLSSDRIRKRLHSVPAEQPLPPEAYAPEISARVYATLRDEASEALGAGVSVIADAVFDRPGEREAIEAIARRTCVPFTGLWLDAPAHTLAQRITVRTHDASDATLEVLGRQMQHDPGVLTWFRTDARRPVPVIVADVLALLQKSIAAIAPVA